MSPASAQSQKGKDAAATPAPITPYLNARYRLEVVDQDGFDRSAVASTLRLRAGARTATWDGLSALVEGEAIMRLGPSHYNDTTNGVIDRPIVADPSDLLLNQAYVKWQPAKQLEAIVGRQTVNLDNQRWIGSVDWRQNDQTLDAVRLAVTPTANTRLEYVHSTRVNRVFGPDSPQGTWRHADINIVRGSAAITPVGTLVAYGYWLDLPTAPTQSSRTVGFRLTGEQKVGNGAKLLYAAEFARQHDYAANPRQFRHDYLLIEPGVAVGPVTARLGYERLEGDGTTALQTPLATLHAFNGWTDKFLTTPADGLRDAYADIQWRDGTLTKAGPVAVRFQLHDFNATHGSRPYGREAGASATLPMTSRITSTLKVSRYFADRFATDTTKVWLAIEARY